MPGLTDNSVGFPAIHDDESAPNAPLDGSEAAQVNNIRNSGLLLKSTSVVNPEVLQAASQRRA